MLFRQKEKEELLKRSSRSAFAGTLVLAVAVVAALLLVVDMLSPGRWRGPPPAGSLPCSSGWWVAVPLWQRAHHEQETFDD